MNIFWLWTDVIKCANDHFNAHVVKMISETWQLLSTAHWVQNGELTAEFAELGMIAKATHKNHPCAVWVRAHPNNYRWLARLGLALCEEFQRRFSGAEHKVHEKLRFLAEHCPPADSHADLLPLFFEVQVTMPPQCMPEEFQVEGDPVAAYRRYYHSKAHMAWWRPKREPVDGDDRDEYTPFWFHAPVCPPKYFLLQLEKQESKLAGKRRRPDDECPNKAVCIVQVNA